MRIELAGHVISEAPPEPPPDLPITPITASGDYNLLPLKEAGYTNFEVMCIGGGGGGGGGVGAVAGTVPNSGQKSWPGAGGGGGIHRVSGLLSALPDTVAVVIGSGGIPGTWHLSDPASTTDGGNGGYSSFNGTMCRASGGKGGKRVQLVSMTATSHADGGQGGVGNSITAGGGAVGGVASIPSVGIGTIGDTGTWDGVIGKGGGGGAGGVAERSDVGVYFTRGLATDGGGGSSGGSDLSVFVPGTRHQDEWDQTLHVFNFYEVIAGQGGGGKTTPLDGSATIYGQGGWGSDSRSTDLDAQGLAGIVVVKLTTL